MESKSHSKAPETLKIMAITVFIIGVIVAGKTSADIITENGRWDFTLAIMDIEELFDFLILFFSSFISYMSFSFIIYGIALIYDILFEMHNKSVQAQDNIYQMETEK